jgi:hypothetical protein
VACSAGGDGDRRSHEHPAHCTVRGSRLPNIAIYEYTP